MHSIGMKVYKSDIFPVAFDKKTLVSRNLKISAIQ